jgi:hypothetical protein
MTKDDGGELRMEFLRPAEWVEANGLRPGDRLAMELLEMHASGKAELLAVEPSPPIAPRPSPHHRLVTGKYAHASAEVLNLSVEGLEKPLGTTALHPFWSEDRDDFVPAESLRVGERLRASDGQLHRLTSLSSLGVSLPVYNLEVDGEHVYYVSRQKLLVHNNCLVNKFTNKPSTITTEEGINLAGKGPVEAPGAVGHHSNVSPDVIKALAEIDQGLPRPNVRSAKPFTNDGRGGTAQLPTTNNGRPVQYTEYTVNPRPSKGTLDGKRIIMGNDGSVWATLDHFLTWIRIR